MIPRSDRTIGARNGAHYCIQLLPQGAEEDSVSLFGLILELGLVFKVGRGKKIPHTGDKASLDRCR